MFPPFSTSDLEHNSELRWRGLLRWGTTANQLHICSVADFMCSAPFKVSYCITSSSALSSSQLCTLRPLVHISHASCGAYYPYPHPYWHRLCCRCRVLGCLFNKCKFSIVALRSCCCSFVFRSCSLSLQVLSSLRGLIHVLGWLCEFMFVK